MQQQPTILKSIVNNNIFIAYSLDSLPILNNILPNKIVDIHDLPYPVWFLGWDIYYVIHPDDVIYTAIDKALFKN